jgi:hypothetical protein
MAWETLGKDAKGVDVGKYVLDVYKIEVPSSTISIAKKKVFPELFENGAPQNGHARGKTLFEDAEGEAPGGDKARRTRSARVDTEAIDEIDQLLTKLAGGNLTLAARILGVAAAFGSVAELKSAMEKLDAAIAAAGGREEFEEVLAALRLKK